MLDPSFNILKTQEDYQTWEKLIEHCNVMEGLSEMQKENGKRSFNFLKAEFGNDFLKNTPDHPLCGYFHNLAPWTRLWIYWFAEVIKEIKNSQN